MKRNVRMVMQTKLGVEGGVQATCPVGMAGVPEPVPQDWLMLVIKDSQHTRCTCIWTKLPTCPCIKQFLTKPPYSKYISLVQACIEYADIVWDPRLQCDIQLLERTQRFVFKMSTKAWNAGMRSYYTLRSFPLYQNIGCSSSYTLYMDHIYVTFLHM